MGKYKKTSTKAKGSLTLEAALVVPIFIYAILAFIYFLQIINIQEAIQHALNETGLESVRYAYVYDYIKEFDNKDKEENTGEGVPQLPDKQQPPEKEENEIDNTENKENEEKKSSAEAITAKLIDSIYFKNRLEHYLDKDFINNSCIKGGMGGISTYLSEFMEQDDTIDIIVTYRVKLPLLFFNIDDIMFIQRVRLRGWTGYTPELDNSEGDREEDTEEEMVFITETGTVYHVSKNCSHLRLSTRKALLEEIKELRNDSGGKFKECNICDSDKVEGQPHVYITDTGDRYHWKIDCSGLKRTVTSIPIAEVGSRTKCKRCGK
jgi:hypothetical protein